MSCLGRYLWSTHSPHLTSTLLARRLAVWQKAPPSAGKPNIQLSLDTYFRSAHSRNSRGIQPERCAVHIRTGKPSRHLSLMIPGNSHFCFNVSLVSFRDSTQFAFKAYSTNLQRPTSSRSRDLFLINVFNPRDLYYRGY